MRPARRCRRRAAPSPSAPGRGGSPRRASPASRGCSRCSRARRRGRPRARTRRPSRRSPRRSPRARASCAASRPPRAPRSRRPSRRSGRGSGRRPSRCGSAGGRAASRGRASSRPRRRRPRPGVCWCHSSTWPTTNIPWLRPSSTYRSAGSKSYRSGSGWTASHLSTFSGLIELKWRTTMASPAASFPSLCFWLRATPMRMVSGGATDFSAGASPEAAEVAAASTTTPPSSVHGSVHPAIMPHDPSWRSSLDGVPCPGVAFTVV